MENKLVICLFTCVVGILRSFSKEVQANNFVCLLSNHSFTCRRLILTKKKVLQRYKNY